MSAMSDSLRRSTRRNSISRRRDKYSEGDIVELTKEGGTVHGRLVGRLSEESSSPWVVTFDDQSYQDEEVLEDDLGPVIARVDDSDGASKSSDLCKTNIKKNKGIRSKSAVSDKTGFGSDDSGSPGSNKTKNGPSSVNFQVANDRQSNADTDTSSPTDPLKSNKSKVSDREQRSRRRHQTIEDDVPSGDSMKFIHTKPMELPLPASKKAKTKGGDEVVKIPMLTGTLYLYRGAHRRVAFIRKI